MRDHEDERWSDARYAADTLGTDGGYFDPLWRVRLALTPLEQELLGSWWVRRLAFVAHAGAAAVTTTQSYSRLEHSLGVLVLVAHFAPDDQPARAAALLHDVGHLPFSHTLEGVAGWEHHALGRERIGSLEPLLARHGLSAGQVIDLDEGRIASCLRGTPGCLTLDHLDSFLRSGQAHGRTNIPPAEMLPRLATVDGVVDTDANTARELVHLIVGEARAQRSAANVTAAAVIRTLTTSLIERTDPALVARMTDDELWGALLADEEVADTARRFRGRPQDWVAEPLTGAGTSPLCEIPEDPGVSGDIVHQIGRSYLDLPTVGGRPWSRPDEIVALERSLPLRHLVRDRHAALSKASKTVSGHF